MKQYRVKAIVERNGGTKRSVGGNPLEPKIASTGN